jgi:hypothetical protein
MAEPRSASRASGPDGFGKRLEILRRHLGYDTAASFARAYGLNPRVYRGFELGKRSHGDDPLVLLQALGQIGVNLTWVLTGRERQDKPESEAPVFHRRSKRKRGS